ncbi:unnamed protein product [Cuscuta epithymum]|uniref:Uncharacterized protein n=1 Tax=Cuscuta epithymum TaxID=186058 RepID=A0AAV0DA92_9ASTE|nr:unnamed protein product [Cuscuta epithymum]
MQEMKAFYDCGQFRMQKLIYRKLCRQFKKMRPKGLILPRLMRKPEDNLKLPLAERHPPILSSDEEDEPWSDSDNYLLEGSINSKADEDDTDDEADSGAGEDAAQGENQADEAA